jgi:uncharacterized protein
MNIPLALDDMRINVIRNWGYGVLLLLLIGCQTAAQENNCSAYPDSVGFLNDFESLFDDNEAQKLEDLLKRYEEKTSNEIAIVTVSDCLPDSTLESYTLHLARCWGVGKKDLNNGMVIVVSQGMRKIWIQNGEGLVNNFTNQETQSVIDDYMIPNFKNGLYYKGVRDGLKQIFKELK